MVPRARMIHSKVWFSHQFRSLKFNTRLMYLGLIILGDDHGRLIGDGEYLKTQLFPYDSITKKVINKMRDEIRDVELITVYKTKKGIFIYHPNWDKYQKLRKDRMKESEVPDPPSDICPTSDGQMSAQDKVSKDNLSEAEAKVIQVEEKALPVSDVAEKILAGMPSQTASYIRNRTTKDETIQGTQGLSKENA